MVATLVETRRTSATPEDNHEHPRAAGFPHARPQGTHQPHPGSNFARPLRVKTGEDTALVYATQRRRICQ
eukprot:9716992-Lingulodinium_polyedra.AAC.1